MILEVSQCLSDTFDTERSGKSHKKPKTITFMTALWRYQVSGAQSHISDPTIQFLTFNINFLTKSWASGSVHFIVYLDLASALMSIYCHKMTVENENI